MKIERKIKVQEEIIKTEEIEVSNPCFMKTNDNSGYFMVEEKDGRFKTLHISADRLRFSLWNCKLSEIEEGDLVESTKEEYQYILQQTINSLNNILKTF